MTLDTATCSKSPVVSSMQWAVKVFFKLCVKHLSLSSVDKCILESWIGKWHRCQSKTTGLQCGLHELCNNICLYFSFFPLLLFNLFPKLCLTLCNLMDCSRPGFPVFQYLPEFAQTHVHSSNPLLSPFPPTLNLFQHQGLSQWAGSWYQVAKVLELQLQRQYFQWIFRVDFL